MRPGAARSQGNGERHSMRRWELDLPADLRRREMSRAGIPVGRRSRPCSGWPAVLAAALASLIAGTAGAQEAAIAPDVADACRKAPHVVRRLIVQMAEPPSAESCLSIPHSG